MNYRIDFSRLARDPEEIIKDKLVRDFLKSIADGRAFEAINAFRDSLPDGHILDTKTIKEKPGVYGAEILKKHIHPLYPEAKLISWDCHE